MICISDLHVKNKEPFLSSIKSFLKEVADTYPNEEVVQLGDLYDNSSPHSEIEADIVALLKRFKKLHIITGNHDVSKRSGNALLHLNHHDNIVVYTEKTEVEIEGHKCLMVPWVYNSKEVYTDLSWKGDFAFLHITNEEDAFGDEGIKTDNVKAVQIFGHTHTKRTVDNNTTIKYITGVNIPTRNLEISNPYLQIKSDKTLEFIKTKIYFEYETVDYPELPKNKNNILNVKKAPSYEAVYEVYKDYNVRHEGIEITYTTNTLDEEDSLFENGSLLQKFNIYAKDDGVPKELVDVAIKYISEFVD